MRTIAGVEMLVVLLVTGVISADASSNPVTSEAPFADLVARANRDMGTKQGNSYDVVMGKQFASKHGSGVGACVEASGAAVPESFQTVIIVGKNGMVSSVTVNPETEVAKCVRKLLINETFPKPPFAPFHDLMDMNFE